MRRAGESDQRGSRAPSPALPWQRVTVMHLALAGILVIVVWQSAQHLSPGEAGLTSRTTAAVADGVLGPWLHWDAGAFHDIAEHGYRDEDRLVYESGGESRIAYFPGYPILARAVGGVVRDIPLGMITVTFASGLGALILFNRWLRSRMAPDARTCAVLALILFPWAFFLVATGYSDALFLCAALGAFVLMEEDRPGLAMACGIVATLSRPVGAAVTVGLLVIAWQRQRAGQSKDQPEARPLLGSGEVGAAMGSILGLVAFMAFCWERYGHPVAFSVAQRGWGQLPGPRTWFKLTFFDVLREYDDPFFEWRLVVQGLVALLFAAAIPAVWKRFGAAYGAYTAIVVLVPLVGSATFASQGRYMLAAFPVFALLGERLAGWAAPRRLGLLAVSGAGLLVTASFWARGYWMG